MITQRPKHLLTVFKPQINCPVHVITAVRMLRALPPITCPSVSRAGKVLEPVQCTTVINSGKRNWPSGKCALGDRIPWECSQLLLIFAFLLLVFRELLAHRTLCSRTLPSSLSSSHYCLDGSLDLPTCDRWVLTGMEVRMAWC
jgi:hypothetical protein